MIRPFLAVLLLLSACDQPPRVGDSAPIDPRRSTPQTHFEAVTLDPQVLRSHADYDAFENAIIARSGPSLAYMLYKEALVRKRGDQRTFVRWMVVAHRPELGEDYREPLQKFMAGLMQAEEMSPDIKFLVGFVTWQRLIGGPGKPDVPVHVTSPALNDTVIKVWSELALENPDWVGPHGITTEVLLRRVEALKRSAARVGIADDPPAKSPGTLGADIDAAVLSAYTEQGRRPPWEARREKAAEAYQDLHQIYEDKGSKKGCERIAAALKQVDDPTRLGDGPAHCALDKGDAFAAIDQVKRMAAARVEGGIPSILARLDALAASNSAIEKEVAELRATLDAAAKASPRWASRSGLNPTL